MDRVKRIEANRLPNLINNKGIMNMGWNQAFLFDVNVGQFYKPKRI